MKITTVSNTTEFPKNVVSWVARLLTRVSFETLAIHKVSRSSRLIYAVIAVTVSDGF